MDLNVIHVLFTNETKREINKVILIKNQFCGKSFFFFFFYWRRKSRKNIVNMKNFLEIIIALDFCDNTESS